MPAYKLLHGNTPVLGHYYTKCTYFVYLYPHSTNSSYDHHPHNITNFIFFFNLNIKHEVIQLALKNECHDQIEPSLLVYNTATPHTTLISVQGSGDLVGDCYVPTCKQASGMESLMPITLGYNKIEPLETKTFQTRLVGSPTWLVGWTWLLQKSLYYTDISFSFSYSFPMSGCTQFSSPWCVGGA